MELKYITTTFTENGGQTTEHVSQFAFDEERESELINLYPQVQYQQFEGFGGAVTDSAGYVYSLMDESQKENIISSYFGDKDMKYRLVRIPIDSCDFSLEHYEADACETDDTFEKFSFERVEKYILPLLEDAQKKCGKKIEIMLSPWSPPAYMKTNGERNHGGKLKEEYKKRWAKYICRYILEYQIRGFHVTKMSLQNEPKAVQTWDSCIYTAKEQKEFLKDYMWPALVEHKLEDIEIYIWDHNKERAFSWAEAIIDEETAHMIAGIAFHWYSGDHFEGLRMIKERFPNKKLMLSEACIEYSKYSASDSLHSAQKYAHDMIGNLNEGMNTFLDWNIVLDSKGGPNHVGNYCDAPYLFNAEKKELIKHSILSYLWHFSHFIEPGAVRIGISRYTEQLEVTAFQNRENIVLVVLNRTEKEIPAYIRMNDKCVKVTVKPNSISTGVIS